MNRRSILLFVLALVSACGPKASRGTTPASRDATIADDAAYAERARAYQAMPISERRRDAERERLLAYLGSGANAVANDAEYDATLARVRQAVELYLPEELARHPMPGSMDAAIASLSRAAAARGEEGVTLGALDLLRTMHPEDAALREEYDRVLSFSRDARQSMEPPVEREDSLLDVYVAEASVAPTTEVLERTATQYEVRRDALFGGGNPRAARAVEALLVETPLEVAGLYLAHQDLEGALRSVEKLGTSGSAPAVTGLLRVAVGEGDEAIAASWELVEAYAPRRPEVAKGLCYRGRRDHPHEPRFPLCLARIATVLEHHAEATAYYAEAIDDDPDERELYDEALAQLGRLIAAGLFDSDPAKARLLATRAEGILAERTRRFPDASATVPVEQFQFLFGMLEMNSGNLDAAERRFEASVAAEPSGIALRQWGILLERRGKPEEAIRRYREALDLTPQEGEEGPLRRAEVLEHMGDAYRESGDAEQAKRMYRQALEPWDTARGAIEDERLALVEARRGVLLGWLERENESIEAFRAAISGPAQREIFAAVLSHLVVHEPNVALAEETYRQVVRQGALEPEWKVYFGLWTRLVAARAGATEPAEVDTSLRSLAGDSSWTAKLAAFGTSGTSFERLLAQATTIGERCEAYFYEGARLLATGDREGAKRRFREALATNMVSFFEYEIARELLRTLP